jgi:PilZ domain-containing protein
MLHDMSDSDSAPPSSNRRKSDRYVAFTMASLERPDGELRPALVHDLSESGALLLVRTAKVFVDDEVALHLPESDGNQKSRVVHGHVVRVEEVLPGDTGPWLRRVGVCFREPLQMFASEIEGFRRRTERLGIGQ